MNIVKRSVETKKPYTPNESSVYQRKKSFVIGFNLHDANVPVNTIIDDSNSIATDMPSTPIEKAMFSGSYQLHDAVYSIVAVSPALRS